MTAALGRRPLPTEGLFQCRVAARARRMLPGSRVAVFGLFGRYAVNVYGPEVVE